MAGGILFRITFEVDKLEKRLATLNRDIKENQLKVLALRADWHELNRPERLEILNSKYLKLQPLKSSQFLDASSIPQRVVPASLVTRKKDPMGEKGSLTKNYFSKAPIND
jgi:hypothetical protein